MVMPYTGDSPDPLSFERLAGHLGAVAAGADLRDDVDEARRSAIWNAVLKHKVVFFRGQRLNHADHVRLARHFRELTRRPSPHSGAAPEGFPEILTVDTKARDPRFGEDFEERYLRRWMDHNAGWHTDLTPALNPPKASILRAEAVTSFGGDTHWTSLEAANARLRTRR